MQDLTFKNEKIHAFFFKDSDVPPSAELMYIHTHKITENFLSEIEVTIGRAAALSLGRKSKSVGVRIETLARKLAGFIPTLSLETADQFLYTLHDLHQLALSIIERYETKNKK